MPLSNREVRREIEAALIDLARSRRESRFAANARADREASRIDLGDALASIDANEYEIADAIRAAIDALNEIEVAIVRERSAIVESDRYLTAANEVAIAFSNFVAVDRERADSSASVAIEAFEDAFLVALDDLDSSDDDDDDDEPSAVDLARALVARDLAEDDDERNARARADYLANAPESEV